MTRFPALVILLAALAAVGCDRTLQDFTPAPRSANPPADPPPEAAGGESGTLTGRVVWTGELPVVPPIRGVIGTPDGPQWGDVPNHFAPRIDPKSKGVADAVVYLNRRADTGPAWSFPPTRIEQQNSRIQIRQGEHVGRVGFVRVGQEIEMVSRDEVYHALRARGAAFFTLPFPEPDKVTARSTSGSATPSETPALPSPKADRPVTRRFDTPGHVEFTSAAGFFWTAADLFVCDHGFYTTTGAEGRFELKTVPPGEYEVVAWVRNWEVLGRDRDPETGKIVRLQFADPFRMTKRVTVAGGKMADVGFALPPTK